VVRPFLLDKKELEKTPEGYQSRKAKGGEFGGLNYTIQLAPFDCTGCEVCVEMCPDDALVMKPQKYSAENHNEHWEFSMNQVSLKNHLADKNTVKGSQFQLPLMEFSGACSGCGETPYVKLLTQMFGERMVIANSSGCSSVWGGSYGLSPFRKNEHGQGPAWARSLFEDTAEYGLGMSLGSQQRREKLIMDVQEVVDMSNDGEEVVSKELLSLLEKWIKVKDDPEACNKLQFKLAPMLEAEAKDGTDLVQAVHRGSDLFVRPSHWIIGGDGWAYDIGFGGLDHVLASGQNINILVLDTEGYSNTGAQVSKATPMGATMKMAAGGKAAKKKDLGAIAMMHESAYVASVSLSADVNQTLKAFKEAEAYPGPSLVVAYATCVDWGHRMGDKAMVQQQVQAVDSGYWPLYRYNPDKVGVKDQMGFELDNKRIDGKTMEKFLMSENRFTSLQRSSPEHAKMLQQTMTDTNNFRHETRKRASMNDEDLLEHLKKMMGEQVSGEKILVLYGSDTGNAEVVAKNFQFELKRRGMKAKCMAFNELDMCDLPEQSRILAIMATAGQGDMPKTAVKFWEQMETFLETAPEDYMKDTKFAVFGLGDSSYVFFNEAAVKIDDAFSKLGAQRLQEVGMGDDQHAGRFDTVLEDWTPDFMDNIEAPAPPQELGAPTHLVELLDSSVEVEPYVPDHSQKVTLNLKRSTVPEGYERPIDHFEFDLTGSGLSYEQGDSLGLWASNPQVQVDKCLQALKLDGDTVLKIQAVDSNRSTPLPETITARKLLTDVLDIAGWPKRRFYEMLKMSATDPNEKEELETLCSREGKEQYLGMAEESYTYAELLEKYPSATVSIGHLLDYVPDIKPRLYSIASSPRMRGEDECHLCIIRNDWTATSGRTCVGLSTGWLDALQTGNVNLEMNAKVHAAAVTMPQNHETPLVMVALGTGIAPMRAFIEERVSAFRAGEKTSPMALFFGARNRQEYSYEQEFSDYQKEGPLTHIVLALSREQKEKIYVTHRLQQEKEMVYDLIHEKKGNLYLCGPGGNVPPQVRKGVIDAIRDCGGHSQEYAEKYVEDMQIQGRYNVEAW
jgi:sulfite reductase alpha subunit-like flavoprotein/ferredoxin